jgi:ribosomal protein L28
LISGCPDDDAKVTVRVSADALATVDHDTPSELRSTSNPMIS